MGDWKQKLADAVRPYINRKDLVGFDRYNEIREWCNDRDILNLQHIHNPQHVVELMELIDRWHDEDAAKQPCAAPAPTANPFLIESVVRELICTASDEIAVILHHDAGVDIVIKRGFYTPKQLRSLAKQLTDLADAHEAVYPPQQHPDDL